VSLNELGAMLEEMKYTTEQLRNIFYEQEKKIEYLKRDLLAVEELQRQKGREQQELTNHLEELERILQSRKQELYIEKENEADIMSHQTELLDRNRELGIDIRRLEDQQRKVSL
jgi:hypothetical protein